MLVEGAERFGLSQLHQLRGRVGRGEHESCCILFGDAKGGRREARLGGDRQSTRDGFTWPRWTCRFAAGRDPRERSGLPRFQAAVLPEDTAMLLEARRRVIKMLEEPRLTRGSRRWAR